MIHNSANAKRAMELTSAIYQLILLNKKENNRVSPLANMDILPGRMIDISCFVSQCEYLTRNIII